MRLEGMRATLIVGALVCLAESFPIQATIYAPIADDELIRRATAVAVVEIKFRFSTESTADGLKQRLESILKKHQLDYVLKWTLGGLPL